MDFVAIIDVECKNEKFTQAYRFYGFDKGREEYIKQKVKEQMSKMDLTELIKNCKVDIRVESYDQDNVQHSLAGWWD